MRLIDADALIELREEMWKDRCDYMVVRVTNIENAPTIDPVKHGRWKVIITGPGTFDYCFECSECDGQTPDKAYAVSPDYCPVCGAKMDL